MNLLGQNIGQNYRGIINLGATINSPLSTTLQAVTDGMGNNSPLQLSTTLARVSSNLTIGGSEAASARLHVRGDGTNPIARFESGAGALAISVSNIGQISWSAGDYFELLSSGRNLYSAGVLNFLGTWTSGGSYIWNFAPINNITATTGTNGAINLTPNFAAAVGSANFRPLAIAYTINNSGAQTGTATGIFLNATETALNGMAHNLMDLQVGGVSRFSVDRSGNVTGNIINSTDAALGFRINGATVIDRGSGVRINNASGTQNVGIYYNSGTLGLQLNGTNGLLQFGGTTNAFPAIKRNGAAIDFRLADDSAFCSINCSSIVAVNATSQISTIRTTFLNDSNNAVTALYIAPTSGAICINGTSVNASAQFQIDSTTRGFLPPRGSNAQMLAIASPATGLIFFDTTNNKLNCYDGTNWQPCW